MTHPLLTWWRRLEGLPGGKWFFSRLLGFMIPYSGTVRPSILELEPGHARVAIGDRRKLRNHLRCIHAIAQMNVAEFCTGLAMTSLLSVNSRAIITGLSIEFMKKARGRLSAECRCEPFDDQESQELQLICTVCDAAGDEVSRATALWLIGPREKNIQNSLPAEVTSAP